MQYKIDQIGTEFSDKGIQNLVNRLNSNGDAGWKFHSVFHVQKPGCLVFGSPSNIYLVVYMKE